MQSYTRQYVTSQISLTLDENEDDGVANYQRVAGRLKHNTNFDNDKRLQQGWSMLDFKWTATNAQRLRFIVLEVIREFNDEQCFDYLHLFHSLGQFGGFHFCPCDRLTYLSVQYFVSTLRFRFKQIERCAMLFDGRIVWSCIPVAQMRSVYTQLLFAKVP